MSDPSVTIVIPCYNAEKYLEDAILSVLRQNYWNKQIIVVDDKSTDGSVEITKKYPSVTLIQHQENKGPCAAVETGFLAAKSDYIHMLAADDMFIDQYQIYKQVCYLVDHSLDWCYDGTYRTGPSPENSMKVNTKWFLHFIFDNLWLDFLPRFCCLLMTWRNPINASTLMIKTESFRNHNLSWYPKERSVCDGYLVADMILNGMKSGVMSNGGVFYRIHPEQVSNTEMHTESNKRFKQAIYKKVLGNLGVGD
jgi:glycosyltransferase involved in cell wall biosynthesis